MISIIDTHAHLDATVFDGDREAVISAALGAGVHAIVLIGYDPDLWATTAHLCQLYPQFVRTVGIHPNSADIWNNEIEASISTEVELEDAIAIGEIGLDFFRGHASQDVQLAAFQSQLHLAQRADLPIVIHQRSAEDEVLGMIEKFAPVKGVMHCFSGNDVFAQRCIDFGLHLGIGGYATYPKAAATRSALTSVSLERLVVETDAPYLAPQAIRGQRNDPSRILAVIETLATIYKREPSEIASITTANAEDLFGDRLRRARQAGMELAACHS